MHTAGLKYEDLLSNVKRLLDLNGSFAVLLPSSAEIKFIDKAAKFGLFATEITRFKQSTKHSFIRSVPEFHPIDGVLASRPAPGSSARTPPLREARWGRGLF